MMAAEVKMFRTYYNGQELIATVYKSLGGYSLSVNTRDWESGKNHPVFDHCYKDERGALRAMNTRFRGAEWNEI